MKEKELQPSAPQQPRERAVQVPAQNQVQVEQTCHQKQEELKWQHRQKPEGPPCCHQTGKLRMKVGLPIWVVRCPSGGAQVHHQTQRTQLLLMMKHPCSGFCLEQIL
jgi:hypothetical protein